MVQAGIDYAQSFKHLNCTPVYTYNGINSSDTGDNDGVACNGKMLAVSWSSMSSIAVFNAEKPQNFGVNIPLLKGHSGTIYDL